MDNVTAIIDSLGALQAQRKALETEEKILKEQIVAITGGNGKAEGQAFKVVVTTADRSTLDMKAVREKLTRQFKAAHTVTKSVTQVKVAKK